MNDPIAEAEDAFARGDYAYVRRVLAPHLRASSPDAERARAIFDRTRPSRGGTWLLIIAAAIVIAVSAQWLGFRP